MRRDMTDLRVLADMRRSPLVPFQAKPDCACRRERPQAIFARPMSPCEPVCHHASLYDEEHLRREMARPHCASNIALAAAFERRDP
jgi:hypothetical protein